MVTRKCSGQRTGWTGKPLICAADRRSAGSRNGATVCEPCGSIPLSEPFCHPQTSPAGPPPGRRVRPVREPRARTAVRRSRDHPPLRFAFFAQFRLAAGIKCSVAESHIVRPVFPRCRPPGITGAPHRSEPRRHRRGFLLLQSRWRDGLGHASAAAAATRTSPRNHLTTTIQNVSGTGLHDRGRIAREFFQKRKRSGQKQAATARRHSVRLRAVA